jgi:hypothetical protein
MVRRRWAAAVGLVACLLMLLHVITPGLADAARSAVPVMTAEEPCPCEQEPSGRQLAARTPRAAATGVGPVMTGAAVPGGSGPHLLTAGTPRCPEAVGSTPSTARLQAFRC